MALLIIQEIQTEWTKASRGAPRANLRNAVPESVCLPGQTQELSGSLALHHFLRYGEWNDFSSPDESHVIIELADELCFGCVRIYPFENHIKVVLAYDMTHGGAPERESYPKTVFELHANTWGTIVYNGRFSEGHDSVWMYRQTVCNIGMFDRFSASVFTDSQPISMHQDLAKLR